MTVRRTRLAVVAVGGNALIRNGHESLHDQFQMVSTFAADIAAMVDEGWNVLVTHGNGPQIGFVLRRSEISIHQMPPVPMDYAGADIQGAVGWMFVRALRNEFHRRSLRREAVAVVTQTLVDRRDPAFRQPSKPIGSSMDEDKARQLADQYHWTVHRDPGRGWRRVVASPRPQAIVETGVIRSMVDAGYIVVACGGGGIPVAEDPLGNLQGVEAVIDKDLASDLLARSLGAEALVILTGIERVALNFNQPSQRWVDRMTLTEARQHFAQQQFDEGSMGPKIEALIGFVGAGGSLGLITDAPNLQRAMRGETGTRVVPD